MGQRVWTKGSGEPYPGNVCAGCGKTGTRATAPYVNGITEEGSGRFTRWCAPCAKRHAEARAAGIQPPTKTEQEETAMPVQDDLTRKTKVHRAQKAIAAAKQTGSPAPKPAKTPKARTPRPAGTSPTGRPAGKWFGEFVHAASGEAIPGVFAVEVFNETLGLSGAAVLQPARRATPDWTEADEAALQAYVATIGAKPKDRYQDILNPGTEAETAVARTVRKNPYPTTATMPRRDETIAA